MTFESYQYAALASRLLNQSPEYVSGALEVLAGERGLDLGEEASGFVRGAMVSEEGIKTAIGIYGSKYMEQRGEQTPGSLLNWYNPVLEGLENEQREAIFGILEAQDETVESIDKASREAKHKLEGPEGMYTPEELREARETIRRYEEVNKTMGTLDRYMMENLRPDAVDATRKRELGGLARELAE